MKHDSRLFNALMMTSMIFLALEHIFSGQQGHTRDGWITLVFVAFALAFAYRWGAAAQAVRCGAKDDRR